MNWISANWDKAVLLLVSLIVILIGVMFVKRSLEFSEGFTFAAVTPDPTLPETEMVKVKQARATVDVVAPWQTPVRGGEAAKDVPLFVSVPIIEVEGKIIDILDPSAPMIREPVSNAWLRDNGLPYENAGVLEMDQDNDGFTNLEEWTAKTSPIDPAAHPPFAEKLVMLARRQQSYIIEFAGTPDANSYQLTRHRSNNYDRQTFILGLGETTEDGKLKLENYEPIEALSPSGIRVDASKLTVTYLDTGDTVDLVRNVQETIPTYFLEVDYSLGTLEQKFYKIGDEIVLPNDPATTYKVVEINEDNAVLSYLDSNGNEIRVEIKSQS